MSEAEQQLRAMLKDKCGADSLEVLHAVLQERAQALGEEFIAHNKTRRSLSALREAVRRILPWLKEESARPSGDWAGAVTWASVVTLGDCRALLAAYDGAQVAQPVCNRCCTRPATHEAVLRRVTWQRLCDECLAKDSDPASYVAPDGRMLPQVAQRCTLLPDDCGSPARCVAAGACQEALTTLTLEDVLGVVHKVLVKWGGEDEPENGNTSNADELRDVHNGLEELLAQKGAGRGR